MFFNTLDVALNTRKENAEAYHLQMTQGILDILFLIFEFKIATSQHIAKFLSKKDQDKYVYFKLRKMWEVGLLESFKVYAGSSAGMPVYYLLSKKGLKLLQEQERYDRRLIKNYPRAKPLLSWALFVHEAQVVELASMEAKNNSKNLNITFTGKVNLSDEDFQNNETIEIFTPDYTATYSLVNKKIPIYTEYERTVRSKEGIMKKVERYAHYLNPEKRQNSGLRIIFQNPEMEKQFWLKAFTDNSSLFHTLKLFTTNILLLDNSTKFLEPIYASERSIQLAKSGRLSINITERMKLFPFL